ncbi:NfeD family protein [bacterium]|nr:NfeD family protein [bacterium]
MTGSLLPIALIIFGFLLILIEIFLIPGINIFGFIGLAGILAGLITAYSTLSVWVAHIILAGSVVLAVVIARLITKSNTWQHLVLNTQQSKANGVAVQDAADQELVGKTGITKSALRPSGIAVIDSQNYDVVTEGTFIEKGVTVEIIAVEGNHIVVHQIEA